MPSRPDIGITRWPSTPANLRGALLALALICTSGPRLAAEEQSPSPASDPERLRVAIEAVQRLKGVDLSANPALQSAVNKLVEASKGTPQFVELVRDFKIKGQESSLIDYAIQHP